MYRYLYAVFFVVQIASDGMAQDAPPPVEVAPPPVEAAPKPRRLPPPVSIIPGPIPGVPTPSVVGTPAAYYYVCSIPGGGRCTLPANAPAFSGQQCQCASQQGRLGKLN